MKICSKCKIEKNLTEFYKSKATKDNLDTRCKQCSIERARKYSSPEKSKEKYAEFRLKNPKKDRVRSAIERLLEKVEVVTESGCWIFMGNLSANGYGVIGNDFKDDKKLYSAHRKTFEHFIGEIPKGLNVCHKCDVPSCCNPNHLFLGTQKQNMVDCKEKGRNSIADKNGKSKITLEQANLIMQCKREGKNLKDLSRELPISYWQVYAIANGLRRTYL